MITKNACSMPKKQGLSHALFRSKFNSELCIRLPSFRVQNILLETRVFLIFGMLLHPEHPKTYCRHINKTFVEHPWNIIQKDIPH